MPFAEKIPFEFVEVIPAVGNGPNAAVSTARLGLHSAVMTDIGNDRNGEECLKELKKNDVSAKFVVRHKSKKTNYHYVLWFEDERTILVKHEDFPYKFSPPKKNPRWVYVTSLGGNSLPYQLEIAEWLERNPDIKLAFQPGTFQMNVGYEKLSAFYKQAEVFFCNVQEARRILKKKAGDRFPTTETTEIKELLKGIHDLGPKNILITDGPVGAYAYDGNETWFMPPYPDPKPPYERTGAGDAFSSTFTAAFVLGKNLTEALLWGPVNSMSVVQDIGAQRGLLTREKLEEHLRNAPESYKPRKL